MVKAMVLLRKRSDIGSEEFRRHLEQTHLPLVARLPGLQRLVVNHVVTTADGSVAAYDAIVEDWFDSFETMRTAFAGPEGQAVGMDVPNFLDPSALSILAVEEERRLPATAD